jgi:hypothetical protein
MSTWLEYLLGREKPTPPSPPSVSVTCVRIPANGKPAHLMRLNTTTELGDVSSYGHLYHVPDLRPFWQPKIVWDRQDNFRLDIQQDRDVAEKLLSQHKIIMRQHLDVLQSQREVRYRAFMYSANDSCGSRRVIKSYRRNSPSV